MKQIRKLLYFTMFLLLLFSCKKEFDSKYEKPSWLAGNIYDQLRVFADSSDENASTKLFLTAIDSAGLGSKFRLGSWTVFAPNDAAMKKYITDNGKQIISDFSKDELTNLVLYHTIRYAYSDYQFINPSILAGSNPAVSAAYAGITWRFVTEIPKAYTIETSLADGATYRVLGTAKMLPLFFSEYFKNYPQTNAAESYNYFCPSTTFNGFNAAGAQVIKRNVSCENGYINVIDHVAGPLKNAYEVVTSNPDYSVYAHLLARLAKFTYNATSTKNQPNNGDINYDGIIDNVYDKKYTGLYVQLHDELSSYYAACNTYLVPNNQALNNYLNSNILKFYTSVDSLPFTTLQYLLNGHVVNTACWPEKLTKFKNTNNEPVTIDPAADVAYKQLVSNGLFYGLNKVQSPDIFSSVLAPIFLHPNYSVFAMLLETAGMITTLKDLKTDYTIFVPTNQALLDTGIYYSPTENILYGISSANAKAFVSDYIFKGKLETLTPNKYLKSNAINQNIIKINSTTVQAGGNIEKGEFIPAVAAESIAPVKNGNVYAITKVFKRPIRNLGWYIKSGDNTYSAKIPYDARFAEMYRMINKAGMIKDTALVTSNEYKRFVLLSFLKGTIFIVRPTALTSVYTLQADCEKFASFLMIPNFSLMKYDNAAPFSYPTMLRNPASTSKPAPFVTIGVSYDAGGLIVLTNRENEQVTVDPAVDDIIASNGVIHFITNSKIIYK